MHQLHNGNTQHCSDIRCGPLHPLQQTQTITTHLEWIAFITFETQTIAATAIYKTKIVDENSMCIQLDTRGLTIETIYLNESQVKDWALDDEIEGKSHLGQRLSIPLPTNQNSNNTSTANLEISYTTSPDGSKCTTAQWLPPSPTTGKIHPYFFTQCQAIHARSIIPCMDCPAVKMTYKAAISVPSWSTAVMSVLSSKGVVKNQNGTNIFKFDQLVPISAYLIALAVGQISSQTLSPRCKVWWKPSLLSACAFEFSQTEAFLAIAEQITNMPYQWSCYDLLCLPPSFPFVWMENPCMTFVTPTLLARDQSLTDVVAHEITHSWMGNLVMNLTWSHFWLALDLGDCDPDESYSSAPYEKGFHLLYALERMVGEEEFLNFARAYLKKYAFLTVTSVEFWDFFNAHFEGSGAVSDVTLKSFD